MVRSPVNQEPAFLLHSRHYTDSRILLEFFTENHGRIKAIYRLAKRKKTPTAKPQPFTPMLLDFYGNAELKTLRSLEITAMPLLTAGQSLFCGMYLNELLQKLLPLDSEHRSLFVSYHSALIRLGQRDSETEEVALRVFELELLTVLGYAIGFDCDACGDAIVGAQAREYSYFPSEGFVPYVPPGEKGNLICRSDLLQAIAEGEWHHPEVRKLAKQICRKALQELLGDYQLKSRELFL